MLKENSVCVVRSSGVCFIFILVIRKLGPNYSLQILDFYQSFQKGSTEIHNTLFVKVIPIFRLLSTLSRITRTSLKWLHICTTFPVCTIVARLFKCGFIQFIKDEFRVTTFMFALFCNRDLLFPSTAFSSLYIKKNSCILVSLPNIVSTFIHRVWSGIVKCKN